MIKAEEQAFIRAALQKKLITREDLEEAIHVKREQKSRDTVVKILVRIGALDIKAARKLQAELQIRPHRRPSKNVLKSSKDTRIGPYLVEKFLGAGAMGSVYIAVHEELKRRVALKVLLAEQPTQRAIDRFKREARLTAKLHHPNIVKVYDAGEADGRHFLAMDLVEGQSLDEAMTVGEVDIERAAKIVQRVAEALDYAHSQGVIHRDIKPSNILLDKSGEPKLTDFGLAVLEERDSVRLTKTGAAVGTPAYMAPEQVLGDADRVGGPTDVYGLGAAFYEMLTGKPPFTGQTFLELANNICQQEPKAIRDINPEVPEELEIICLKALEKDLDMRYRTGAELADDLAAYLHEEPITATRPSLLQQGKKWVRRNRTAAMSIFGVALVLAAALGFYFSRPGHLILETVPANVTVLLDGERFLAPINEENFSPGTYELRFDHPGYRDEIPGAPYLHVGRATTTRVTFNLFSTRGTLVVRSKPPGALVEVLPPGGGEPRATGRTTFVREIAAGLYELRVSLPGHLTQTVKEVEVREGNLVTEVPLVELPPDQGRLTLKTEPSDVSVDLRAEGTARRTLLGPFSEAPVGSGDLRLLASKSGYLPRELNVHVERDRTSQARVTLAPLASWTRAIPGELIDEPLIADVDGDGLLDVVTLARKDESRLSAVTVWLRGGQGPIGFTHDTQGQRLLGVVDADDDRFLDIILGGDTEIECRSGQSGYRLWRASLPGTWATFNDAGSAAKSAIFAVAGGALARVEATTGTYKTLADIGGEPTAPPFVLNPQAPSVLVGYAAGFDKRPMAKVIRETGEVAHTWPLRARFLEARPWQGPGAVMALRLAFGPIELRGLRDGPPQLVPAPGRQPRQIEGLATGRLTGADRDDIVIVERGQVEVYDSSNPEAAVWSVDGRRVLPLPTSRSATSGELWVDGRVYDGVTGQRKSGAAADPWVAADAQPTRVVDLDNDGLEDIVTLGRAGRSFVKLETRGSPLSLSASTRGALDMDVDPSRKRIALLEDERTVVLLGEDGLTRWRRQLLSERIHAVAIVGDIDGHPEPEVAVATAAQILTLSGEDGRDVWPHVASIADLVAWRADFNGDGTPDILTAGPASVLSGVDGSVLLELTSNSWSALDETASRALPVPLPRADGRTDWILSSPQALRRVDADRPSWSEPAQALSVDLAPAASGRPLDLLVVRTASDLQARRLDDGRALWTDRGSVPLKDALAGAIPERNLRIAASLDSNDRIRVLDLESGELLWSRALPRGEVVTPSRLALIRDGELAAITALASTGEWLIFDAGTGALLNARRSVDPRQPRAGEAFLRASRWTSETRSAVFLLGERGQLTSYEPRLTTPEAASRDRRAQLSRLLDLAAATLEPSRLQQIEKELRSLANANVGWNAARFALARLLLRAGRATEARAIAEAALEQQLAKARAGRVAKVPVSASFCLVEVLIALKDFDAALAAVRDLRERSRSAAADLATIAGEAALQADAATARPFFEIAVEASPRDGRARKGSGLSRMSEAPDDALLSSISEDLNLALLEFPRDPELRLASALVSLAQRRPQSAAPRLSFNAESLEDAPKDLGPAALRIQRAVALLTSELQEQRNPAAARAELLSSEVSVFCLKRGWHPILRKAIDAVMSPP